MGISPRFSRAQWLVTILLLLVLVGLARNPNLLPGPRDATAQVNPAEDRLEMLAEMRRINTQLERLTALLESGKVKVTVVNAEQIGAEARAEAVAPAAAVEKKSDETQTRIIIRRKGD